MINLDIQISWHMRNELVRIHTLFSTLPAGQVPLTYLANLRIPCKKHTELIPFPNSYFENSADPDQLALSEVS